ncbi:MAG: macro domain-containing protein [Clostridiales bacterium]|nr:macro domain-containing protein [Clostridiales bacterium]
MPFTIIRDDITRVKADAVVNTANPSPIVGGGTESAIYKAAGKEILLAARERIGDIRAGLAVETPAYDLSARFIIHTVCVPWKGGTSGELDILTSCYRESLKLATKLKCKSIAFPLIGTGTYGFPHDLAVQTARSVCNEYLNDYDPSLDVTLVVFDDESYESSVALFKKIKQYVDSNYVENAVFDEYGLTPEDREEMTWLKRRRELYARELNYNRRNASFADDSQKSFATKVFEYADEKGIKDSQLYGGAKQIYFSKSILSDMRSDPDYHPSKFVSIVICLVLRLSLDETLDLMERAGYTLSRSRKADLVVRGCIEHRKYDYFTVKLEVEKICGEDLRKIK